MPQHVFCYLYGEYGVGLWATLLYSGKGHNTIWSQHAEIHLHLWAFILKLGALITSSFKYALV